MLPGRIIAVAFASVAFATIVIAQFSRRRRRRLKAQTTQAVVLRQCVRETLAPAAQVHASSAGEQPPASAPSAGDAKLIGPSTSHPFLRLPSAYTEATQPELLLFNALLHSCAHLGVAEVHLEPCRRLLLCVRDALIAAGASRDWWCRVPTSFQTFWFALPPPTRAAKPRLSLIEALANALASALDGADAFAEEASGVGVGSSDWRPFLSAARSLSSLLRDIGAGIHASQLGGGGGSSSEGGSRGSHRLRSSGRRAAQGSARESPLAELVGSLSATSSRVEAAVPTASQRGFKLVIRLASGNAVEAVAIVHEPGGAAAGGGGAAEPWGGDAGGGEGDNARGRVTVCVSSQYGCRMGCTFCATGTMGIGANLSAAEIVEQVWHVQQRAPSFGIHWEVKNTVFMGMGEPLQNYAHVTAAVRALTALHAMAPSRITVSTVGVPGRIASLAQDVPGVRLALSLHAPSQAPRLRLVPSAAGFPLARLLREVDAYTAASRQSVLVEYILISGVNDADDDARALRALLCGRQVAINLIPYNETSAGARHGYAAPTKARAAAFAELVRRSEEAPATGRRGGLAVTVRWSSAHAREVDGACGQLALLPPKPAGDCATAPRDIEDAVPSRRPAGRRSAAWSPMGGAPGGAPGADAAAAAPLVSPSAEAEMGVLRHALRSDGVPAAFWRLYAPRVFGDSRAPSAALLRMVRAVERAVGAVGGELHLLSENNAGDAPPPALQHALITAGHKLSAATRARGVEAWLHGAARQELLAAYRSWIRAEVLPLLDPAGYGRVVYQAEPTLRISLPGSRSVGGAPRSDAKLFHPASELVYWLPLSRGCDATNAMHVAPSPGAPVEPIRALLGGALVQLGECAAFWGHRSAYGFVPNTSGCASVSLDFRALPWALYREDAVSATRSSHDLRLGKFYRVMDAGGGAAAVEEPE